MALEEEINLDEWFRRFESSPTVAAPPAPPTQLAAGESILHPRIERVIESIRNPPLRASVGFIFKKLTLILGHLSFVEASLARQNALPEITHRFGVIEREAQCVLTCIDGPAMSAARGDEVLSEVLDGVSFAIGHELRKVYSMEVPRLDSLAARAQLPRAELTRAYGLLHNLVQQSTVTLAQVFDPSADGATLFEDYRARREQSVILRRELSLLLGRARAAEEGEGLLLRLSFVNSLRLFREEAMHFLMYKDWDEFERLADEVFDTYDSMDDFPRVLHKFARYLETLLRHVSMRSSLSDQS